MYLESDEQAVSQCAVGQCQYHNEGNQYGDCQDSPSNFLEQDMYVESAASTAVRLVDETTGEVVALDGLAVATVPPGGAAYVDLMTDYLAEFGLASSPVVVDPDFPGTDGELHVANIAIEADTKAALCHLPSNPPAHQVYTLPEVVVGYISIPTPNESLVLTVAPAGGVEEKMMEVGFNWAHLYIPSFPTSGALPD